MSRSIGDRPAGLLPLVHQPVIHWVIEELVDLGVTEFDIILHAEPERVEDAVGDGTRWGSEIRYHLARDEGHPFEVLPRLLIDAEETIILADMASLPHDLSMLTHDPVMLLVDGEIHNTRQAWIGWAVVSGCDLLAAHGATTSEDLVSHLLGHSQSSLSTQSTSFDDFTSAQGLLAAQAYRLHTDHGHRLHTRQIDEGIWVEPGAYVHATARLTAPAYIAAGARIGANVHLEGEVVIGRGAVIDDEVRIQEALIVDETYIGAGLEVSRSLVASGLVTHAGHDVSLQIQDPFLVGSLSWMPEHRWRRGGRRAVAGALLILMAPILMMTAVVLAIVRRGRVLVRRQVISEGREFTLISFGRGSGVWSRFLLELLPGIWHVFRGDLQWIGIAPISPEELPAEDDEWRRVRDQTPGGFITEVDVIFSRPPTMEDRRITEMVYAATRSWIGDLRLLGRWFRAVTSRSSCLNGD